MSGTRNRSATTALILATVVASTPFLAIGVAGLLLQPVQLWLVGGLYAATVLLAARPIRIHPDADLSPSDVAMDLGQLYLLLLALRGGPLERGWRWLFRTGRAQLLWSLAAVITIEIILIEPAFLIPGIPLFVFGYLDIRARFVAERRARLLATLVEVGHAVGMSLDTTEVFRAVYAQ